MRATFLRIVAVLFVVFAAGCHGGGTPSGNLLPQTDRTSSRSSLATGATRIWFSYCAGCPFPDSEVPDKEIDLYAYSASGNDLHDFAFSGGRGIPAIAAVSPDERHVYQTMLIGYNVTIADIDTATYGVRYYSIPIKNPPEYISALLPSPDGRLLYVTTSVRLYVIDTVTRTIARTIPAVVYSPVLSQDGKTIYGQTSNAIIAIDTVTSAIHTVTSATLLDVFTASNSNLYLSTGYGVRIYDIATRRYLKTILSSDFIASLSTDPQVNRLYAMTVNPSGVFGSIVAVDTTTQAALKILANQSEGPFIDHKTHLIYAIDDSGYFCSYSPPTYAKSCAFMMNPSVQWDIVFTH